MPITLALQVRRRPPKSVLVIAAAQMAAVAVNQGFVRVRNAHAIAALKTRKTVEQIAVQQRLKSRLLHLKCLHAARDAARSKDSVSITWRMKPFRTSGLTGKQPRTNFVGRRTMLVTRFLTLLMCFQVLICPALCIDFCQEHTSGIAGTLNIESISTCDCCSFGDSQEKGDSDAPCDPCSKSCNCFCGGALPPDLDLADLSDIFVGLEFASFESRFVVLGIDEVLSCAESRTDQASISGRALLRAYCILLI